MPLAEKVGLSLVQRVSLKASPNKDIQSQIASMTLKLASPKSEESVPNQKQIPSSTVSGRRTFKAIVQKIDLSMKEVGEVQTRLNKHQKRRLESIDAPKSKDPLISGPKTFGKRLNEPKMSVLSSGDEGDGVENTEGE